MPLGSPVSVQHALGSYPVYINPGVLSQLELLISRHLEGRRMVMIADERVFQLYSSGQFGGKPWTGEAATFAPGESSKTRDTWAALTDDLLGRRFGRDSGIIALGGGVTGDLAGFVAATYMRGVPYIQIPTTTVAMLDASVGGKTGVNTQSGKNLVGAFHPPTAVIADPLTLASLPDEEYRGGLAEAVKHGVIADPGYFQWIEDHADALMRRQPEHLAHLVRRSIEIKAEIVSADERESGIRAILNAGHTVAHALERATAYHLSHGQAVAIGLVAECFLAEQLGVARQGLALRVRNLLERLALPSNLPPFLESTAIVGSMVTDKKNRASSIRFALVADLGQPKHDADNWTIAVTPSAIVAAMDSLL